METQLDLIEAGELKWKESIRDFIKDVDCLLTIQNETKKIYKTLHTGNYKGNPMIIKDGPHGHYIEYKGSCTSLQQFDIEKIKWLIMATMINVFFYVIKIK